MWIIRKMTEELHSIDMNTKAVTIASIPHSDKRRNYFKDKAHISS
jgi:hypothetical protein